MVYMDSPSASDGSPFFWVNYVTLAQGDRLRKKPQEPSGSPLVKGMKKTPMLGLPPIIC